MSQEGHQLVVYEVYSSDCSEFLQSLRCDTLLVLHFRLARQGQQTSSTSNWTSIGKLLRMSLTNLRESVFSPSQAQFVDSHAFERSQSKKRIKWASKYCKQCSSALMICNGCAAMVTVWPTNKSSAFKEMLLKA